MSFLRDGPRWISANLRENQLGNVIPGQMSTVALDVYPGKLFHGPGPQRGLGNKARATRLQRANSSDVPARSRAGCANRSASRFEFR